MATKRTTHRSAAGKKSSPRSDRARHATSGWRVPQCMTLRHDYRSDRSASRNRFRARPAQMAGRCAAPADTGRQAALLQGGPGFAKMVARVDAVLSSPFMRARQTADLLTQFAGWPAAIESSALVPGTSPSRLVARLRGTRGQCVAVVGHEPHLSAFISACLTEKVRVDLRLRKGGVAHLTFGRSVETGSGTLAAFLPPRVLRAIR